MPTISQALAIAFEHHRAGRLELAEQICHRILAADPDQADVLHLVGVLAQQTGRHEIAAKYIARAVELNPTDAGFYNNLGAAYKDWGRLDDAIRCYRRAIALRPELAEAHYNLGNALMEEGEQGEAVQCYYRALERKPAYADALNNLGNALKDGGDLAGAAALYRRALEAKPDYAEAPQQPGGFVQAIRESRRGGRLLSKPARITARFRGRLLQPGQRTERTATPRGGCRLLSARGGTEARFRRCPRATLGVVLQEQGRLEDAVQCFRRALELEPDNATTFNNLGNALLGQGDQHAAMACYRQALRRERGHAGALQNCVCGLRYVPDATAEELLAAAVDYDRQHAARFRTLWPRHANPAIADRRLRLGFVSPAFHEAPMRAFLPSSLEHVAPAQCELAFYSTTPGGVVPGGLRLQDFGALWHDASRWSDDQLAGQIRADQIDILFDLAGHAPGNRFAGLRRKPAPVQITWIDSVGTTGLSAIDYLLADRWLIPAGAEANFAERVLRMPAGYVCYGPPENSPPVGPLAALGKGHVTFGSFSRPAKIHARVIRAWSAILHRTPPVTIGSQARRLCGSRHQRPFPTSSSRRKAWSSIASSCKATRRRAITSTNCKQSMFLWTRFPTAAA